MTHYFCPSCWAAIDEHAMVCPVCAYDLDRFMALSYEEKLLLALRHPVMDNRMMAVHVLGRLGSQRAVPEFRRMIEREQDIYLLREVVRALAAIGGCESRSALLAAAQHRSPLVRRLVGDLLASLSR